MPNKYSHGLVLSQQQYRGIINNTDRPLSLKTPPARNSRSHIHSTASSIRSSSNYSTQRCVYSDYLRLEPDPEPEPSYDYRTSTRKRPPSFQSTPSDPPRFESTSSEPSRPPSDQLRLESPFGFRIETRPSPPPELEPTLSEHAHYELSSPHRPNPESSSLERLRLGTPFPLRPGNPRPSLHHKSSSVETQIYAPEATIPPPPTRERQDLISVETHESYPTPPSFTEERQHVFSMGSPETSPPPIFTEDRQGRFPSETQRAYLPSPTRDRRQNFAQKTQALASPTLLQSRQAHSPFGTQNSPLFPSAREIQDYFSIATQGSQSTPAATEDRRGGSSVKARSALLTPSQDDQDRLSLDIQRLQSSSLTSDHQRRPSWGTQHSSSGRRPQIMQGSVHGRRQSIDSQNARDRQNPPLLGPRQLSLNQCIKETQHSRRQSIDPNTAQERQPRRSLSTQQLSLEQFIQESEHTRNPSTDSQIYSPQLSSSYTGRLNPRQTNSANAQRYTPRSTSLEHSPRSRRDRPSALPELQRTRPPPIPQRSARRSPSRQRSILRSTNSSVVYLPSEPPRPETSSAMDSPTNSREGTALHSPTFSPRRFSTNATMSPQSVSFSNFSETMTSPRRVSFSQSRDREYFEDADLESLPSEIDFNVLPYEDHNAGPAIFRATQLGIETPVSPRYENPHAGPASFRASQPGLGKPVSRDRRVSSRASSFDSAAPPPIGLNRRISHAIAESYQARMPKKESRMSLLSFLRSTPTPKAVLYSEVTQGKPPVPVSISRTAAPSIPLLFPGYRGQFPPMRKMQDKGLRSGLEPRVRPGLNARTSAPRSTAHTDAAEKRKSWFKGDDDDQSHGAGRPARKAELERILSNL
ncbi:hypothetical protein HO173_010673 [Letharia columbiana]|uniref:Uncharacterized protein n=1 Tax=Letharia columbiana TaxID=112416 RepID=A0A8H6FMD6_9LECA|nr:uncharacterized protein HO173_010673 [Letharia columbiana]KAF6231173.1 hypothetical protein HO173_010673 [Letharia columbiana]